MGELVAVGVDEWHEEPVDVVDVLWMGSIIFYQLSDDVSHAVFHHDDSNSTFLICFNGRV